MRSPAHSEDVQGPLRAGWIVALVILVVLPTNAVPAESRAFRGGVGLSDPSVREAVTAPGVPDALVSPRAAPELTESSLALNWTELNLSPAPPTRYDAAMAYDAADGYVVLFGGLSDTNALLGDTWRYQDSKWTELCSGTGEAPQCSIQPPADSNVPMVYDPQVHDLMLVSTNGATYSFSHGNWSQTAVNQSLPNGTGRWGMAYDSADGYVLLLCYSEPSSIDTTYAFESGSWVQLGPAHSPSLRTAETLFYDDSGRDVMLVGGYDPLTSTFYDETWSFRDGDWTQVNTSPMPPIVTSPAIAFDSLLDGVVWYWGGTHSYTWVFKGGSWTNQTANLPQSPPGRWGEMMTYDGTDGYSLLMDGSNGSSVSDAWVLWDPVRFSASLSPAEIDVGQSFLFWSTVTGGVGPFVRNYSGLPPGCAPGYGVSRWTCLPNGSGNWTFVAYVHPTLGKVASVTLSVTVNPELEVAPEVSPNPADLGTEVGFTPIASGGTSPITAQWNIADYWSFWTPNITVGPGDTWFHAWDVAPGVYLVVLHVWDAVGTSAWANTTVQIFRYPTVVASAAPNATDVGLPVWLNCSEWWGAPPFFFAWWVSNLSRPVSVRQNSTYAFTLPGVYFPTVEVWDSVVNENWSTARVIVNPDPVVIPTSSASETPVGFPVNLTSTVVGGTPPFAYSWWLGDGTHSAWADLPHVYSLAGVYHVTLTVTDAAGFSQAGNLTITVTNVTPTPRPPGESNLTTTTGFTAANVLFVGVAAAVMGIAAGVLLAKAKWHRTPPKRGAR